MLVRVNGPLESRFCDAHVTGSEGMAAVAMWVLFIILLESQV